MIELKKYEDSYWEEFVDFIDRQWGPNHPITQKNLFDWQFNGFGNDDCNIKSYTLFNKGEMIGFRGVIPGIYQIPRQNELSFSKGGSFSMWYVDEKYRGQKLGLKLHLAVQEMLDVIITGGSTFDTSVPFYLREGFKMLDSMHRYILPLNIEGYSQLLCEYIDIDTIKYQFNIPEFCSVEYPVQEPNCFDCEKLWTKMTAANNIFSVHRSQDFLKWRYIDNVGFKYLFFGDPNTVGFIIARIENVESDLETHRGLKVFRIIEIVPKHDIVWKGKTEKDMRAFFINVLGYAKSLGCVAVDFFHSSNMFNELLMSCGFRKQKIIEMDKNKFLSHDLKELKLAAIFAPFRKYYEPLNVLYRIYDKKSKRLLTIPFDNTCIVKSDGDMDRPNIINQKAKLNE
tara:strand:- start:10077 stop:11270 length:1194 start_codon:yes stop_codon:yes gene_type:complete